MNSRLPSRAPVRRLTGFLAILFATLAFHPSPSLAQGRAAGFAGTARTAGGAPVAGVAVVVSSEALIGTSRTVETDAGGAYRVDGLPPGLYLVVLTLDGMKPVMRNATLDPGQILTLDAVMEPGPPTEVNAVIGDGPLFEGRSPAANAYLRDDLLPLVPVDPRFGPEMLAYLPGVTERFQVYGSSGPGDQGWLVDRADISDPRSGERSYSLAHAWVDGVRQSGLGADADAGPFSGVSFNRVLRAGSNLLRGSAGLLVEDGWLTGDNVSHSRRASYPRLTPPTLDGGVDLEVQAGGPLARDRAWLFAGWQYSHVTRAPAGFDAEPPADYPAAAGAPPTPELRSPRLVVKPTVRLGPAATLSGHVIAESLDRDGVGAGPGVAPAATAALDSSARGWNVAYQRLLPGMSLLELGYSGTSARRTLSPYDASVPGWYDVAFDYAAVNARRGTDTETSRQTVGAALTLFHHGLAGEHDLTVGASLTAGDAESAMYAPGATTILAASGRPFAVLDWDGAVVDDRLRTTSFVVEDRWVVAPRITLTPGLRVDANRGRLRSDDRTVFSTTPWSPRIGLAWDPAGDSRTVVRAAAGIAHDALRTSFFERAGDAFAPTYQTIVAADLTPIGPTRLADPGTARRVASDIAQPRRREFVIGADREILPGIFISAAAIWRTYDQFVDDALDTPLSAFVPVVTPDPGADGIYGSGDDTGQTLDVYLQFSPPATNTFTITNPDDAERQYRAFQIAGRKRLSNGWQVQGAWVVSRTTGNYDPATDGAVTRAYDDPNADPALQPLLEGRLAADTTHIASAAGSYTLPYGILLSGTYRFATGAPYTRTVFQLLPTGPADLFVERRGAERLAGRSLVDVRFERLFDAPHGDVAVTVEGFNLANSGAVLERVARSGPAFGEPRALVAPRTFRLGASWRF